MKTPLILLLIHLVCLSNAEFLKQVVDNVFTNQTVITRLNDSLILRQTFAFDELVDKWTFANSDGIVSRIYANQALNQSFSSMFQCQPAINDCKRLIAERSNISFVGEYYRYSDSTDNVKNTMTTFRVSLYEGPLRIECLSSGACRYNATSRVLTIRESLTHNLSSVVRVTRFSDHELPIEIFYKSTPMREECLLNENRRVSVAKIGPKLEVTELAKNCSMAFSRSDRAITLGLRYVHGVNANGEIETMDVALDVQYGPERVALASAELNPTFIVGDSRTLKCPFVGAPIAYYWKILESKDTTEFSGTRELTLPRNLAAGTYKYQCRAHVGGFVGNTTEMVMFTVTVNSVLYADKKKYNLMSDAASNLHTQNLSYFKNLGGIIGGIVGGVVGLIVVVLLIAVIIKCRKAVPQDENDKAKELDMGSGIESSSNQHMKKQPIPSNGQFGGASVVDSGSKMSSYNNNINSCNSSNNMRMSNEHLLMSNHYQSNMNPNGASSIANVLQHQPNASSYAALAHAAAAAVATQSYQSGRKTVSYNNPSFYDTNNFANNTGESPPSYDAALKQESPKPLPKQYQPSPMHHRSQNALNNEFSSSRNRLNQFNDTNQMPGAYNPTPNANVQYSDVTTLNKARNRGPIINDVNPIQYSSVSHFTLPPASNV